MEFNHFDYCYQLQLQIWKNPQAQLLLIMFLCLLRHSLETAVVWRYILQYVHAYNVEANVLKSA